MYKLKLIHKKITENVWIIEYTHFAKILLLNKANFNLIYLKELYKID